MIFLRLVNLYLISGSGLFAVSNTEFRSSIFYSCHAKFHSCENPVKNSYCSCDHLCKYYDDCCFNADGLSDVRTESDKLTISYIEETSCEHIAFNEIPTNQEGAFMVSSCPASWKGDIDVKYKCEQQDSDKNFLDLVPVFDIGTNVTFNNRQCALCHNVNNWIPWLLKFTCGPRFYQNQTPSAPLSLQDEMKLIIKSESCRYRFEPSNHIKVRYCYHELEYIPWKALKDVNSTACKNRALAPFGISNSKTESKFYRNIQCHIDELNFTYLDKEATCFMVPTNEHSVRFTQTISSLIDITALFSLHRSIKLCSETEIYLSEKIGCKPLYCPANMEPFDGRCTALTYKSRGVMLDLLFEINSVVHVRKIVIQTIAILIETLINELDSLALVQSVNTKVLNDEGINVLPGYNVTSRKPCSIIQVRYILDEIPNSNTTLEYQKSKVYNFISNFQQNISNSVNMKHVDDVTETLCTCNVILRNPSYVVKLLLHDTELPCPAVKVHLRGNFSDSNDVNGSVLNGTLFEQYFLNGLVIESTDVLLNSGSYFLCVDTFISKYQAVNENHLTYHRYFVNTICTCLSVVSLVYSLVQYCGIPFLRQGKSELLFVLMIYLLFAQTSFLLISHVTVENHLCQWMGVLHHFVWVGTFTFMFLCSTRLNSEIRNLTALSKSDRSSETFKYCLIGFVLNISIVLCTKILNLLLAPMETWYGGKVCFISHVYVLLLAFVLPISFFLCGNIILYILIIHYVNATSMSSETDSNKSTLFALIKISSVMGFSWIIGIIAIFVQSDILLIFFENISSLQGMFITLSFSCNNRVKKFYNGLCFNEQTTTSSKSNQCTSTELSPSCLND